MTIEPSDPTLRPIHRAELTGVSITVCCPACDTQQSEVIEMDQNTGPGWEIEMEHRWVECDTCGELLDVGFGCDMEAAE